jgi:hypothetical protein
LAKATLAAARRATQKGDTQWRRECPKSKFLEWEWDEDVALIGVCCMGEFEYDNLIEAAWGR